MQCEQAHALIGAYMDGELSAEERGTVEAHLAGCARCRDVLADGARIGRGIRRIGRQPAPASLVPRVRERLGRIALEETTATIGQPQAKTAATGWHAQWQRAAVLVAACCLSAIAAWWGASSAERRDRIEREVVGAHIRSLMQETPVQVASTDQHTVRPWFAGRADFAPNVKDLAGQDFPLVGSRLDYIDDRRIGAVVYKRRLHVINVFMWPASAAGDVAPRLVKRNGYNLVALRRDGIAHWLVSDLNADELLELARLL